MDGPGRQVRHGRHLLHPLSKPDSRLEASRRHRKWRPDRDSPSSPPAWRRPARPLTSDRAAPRSPARSPASGLPRTSSASRQTRLRRGSRQGVAAPGTNALGPGFSGAAVALGQPRLVACALRLGIRRRFARGLAEAVLRRSCDRLTALRRVRGLVFRPPEPVPDPVRSPWPSRFEFMPLVLDHASARPLMLAQDTRRPGQRGVDHIAGQDQRFPSLAGYTHSAGGAESDPGASVKRHGRTTGGPRRACRQWTWMAGKWNYQFRSS